MNNKNSNQRGEKTKQRQAAATARKQLKNELLNEIRAAAGTTRKTKTRLQRTREANKALAGKGSTNNRTTNRQQMIVEEDEYIQEVTVANQPNFNNVQYFVNPGQAATFPWLATVAQRFEKYQFEYLEFYYKREVSEFATDGQVGKVIFSFDSDATDAAPNSKQQMEDTDPHADCMPSENLPRFAIPKEILQGPHDAFYVRPGAQPAFTDLKTYDIGVLNVATQGILHNVAVGELHVRYKVKLSIPVLENAAAPQARTMSMFQSTAAEAVGATTVATNLALATATSNQLQVVNTAGSFVPPAGAYLITLRASVNQSAVTNALEGSASIFKNGASVFLQTETLGGVVGSAAQVAKVNGTMQALVSANGTDAFTFPVTATYALGVPTMLGVVVFAQA